MEKFLRFFSVAGRLDRALGCINRMIGVLDELRVDANLEIAEEQDNIGVYADFIEEAENRILGLEREKSRIDRVKEKLVGLVS